MTTTGRGAWTTIGFPPGSTSGVYTGRPSGELVGWAGAQPNADLSMRAVNEGVRQLQHRMFHLAGCPVASHRIDGVIDGPTWLCIFWAQHHVGITADGQAGPLTMLHLFWPYLRDLVGYSKQVTKIVGGICQHESAWDPGAVGFSTPDDLGFVQINGPANPTLSEAQRFDYQAAFKYACDRITAALGTPGFTEDAAICSYGYPAVAKAWADSGSQTYPPDPTLNDVALKYVAFIKSWDPGF